MNTDNSFGYSGPDQDVMAAALAKDAHKLAGLMGDDSYEDVAAMCPDCHGHGEIQVGEHYVTREMAIDAGDRSMEGQYYGPEYATCRTCGGDGFVIVESSQDQPEGKEK